MLPWLGVSFRQAEDTGPVDWSYPRSNGGPLSRLVDATAFHCLTSQGQETVTQERNSIHGQGLKEVRRDRRLGLCRIHQR